MPNCPLQTITPTNHPPLPSTASSKGFPIPMQPSYCLFANIVATSMSNCICSVTETSTNRPATRSRSASPTTNKPLIRCYGWTIPYWKRLHRSRARAPGFIRFIIQVRVWLFVPWKTGHRMRHTIQMQQPNTNNTANATKNNAVPRTFHRPCGKVFTAIYHG